MKAHSVILLLTMLVALCHAEGVYEGKGLTVELVSEVTAVRPGQPFYAGLFIRHEPGHHTYWLNPGLAGVATRMEWSLPAGWTAGSIEWPAPDKVKMANINTHGFERDVLLMVKLTPPANLPAGEVTLKTKASWMCCGRTCNPGWHDFTITLPVQTGDSPAWSKAWRPVFEKERKHFPVPAQGWKFSAKREGAKIVLSGEPEKPRASLPEEPISYARIRRRSGARPPVVLLRNWKSPACRQKTKRRCTGY
jgi:DsbC/DsbD-like thiol-disulfide interchange protein